MSFLRRDIQRSNGSCFTYAPVYDWQQKELVEGLGVYPISGAIGTALENTELDDLISDIYFVYDTVASDGTVTTSIANVGIGEQQFIEDFLNINLERIVAQPFYQGHGPEWTRVYNLIKDKLVAAINLNMTKYIKLLETMGFKYDPTANYDMTEIGGDAQKEGDLEDKKSIRGAKTKTETAPELKTTHYTSTYDDTTNGRLDSYDVQTYQGTHAIDSDTGVPIKVTKEFYEGTDPGDTVTRKHTAQVSLTQDEITTPSADKANTHKLIRRGNIGVTTTQQMIEAQRELVKFSLEREIMKDLEDAILLRCY